MKITPIKLLVVRGMTENILLTVEINDALIYHLKLGIEAMSEYGPKYGTNSVHLSIGLDSISTITAYKLKSHFLKKCEKGKIEFPKAGIEYLLLDKEDDDYVLSDEQKQNINATIVSYNDDYYDQSEFLNLFGNLEECKLPELNNNLIVYDGQFSFKRWSFDEQFFSEEVRYDFFAKATEADYDPAYKPQEREVPLRYGMLKNL
ncbi:hypothetical protein [Flavobacterium sp. GP15]|uniref:hypothetical protein n=1 Tax=Flavobacterium sp. GP15 TaxID=2758567 RepID=UPI00165D32B5|nr:hypothetical protein [Flavobacterium sp. GP15]